MLKRLMTVILICLIVCSGSAAAMEPVDDDVTNYDRRGMTVDDAVAVALELSEYEQEIDVLAKVVYREAKGVKSEMEQAAVVWCVLNRVDDEGEFEKHDTIIKAATARNQFAYSAGVNLDKAPNYQIKQDIRALVRDVLTRWLLEKRGIENVGRVLPPEYIYFAGRGGHNWFRDNFKRPYEYWDWSAADPY